MARFFGFVGREITLAVDDRGWLLQDCIVAIVLEFLAHGAGLGAAGKWTDLDVQEAVSRFAMNRC